MISKKVLVADGSNQRFLSEFIIRSEQFCRVYNYMYDPDGVDGSLHANGLYVRVRDLPHSGEDLVTLDKWDLVDNSISFYEPPKVSSRVYIEVATAPEEFGTTQLAPSVEEAEQAAAAALVSENAAKVSETNAKLSETNAANSASSAANSVTNAANSASAASNSAVNAATSETNAANSAAEAANSALNGGIEDSGTSGTTYWIKYTDGTMLQYGIYQLANSYTQVYTSDFNRWAVSAPLVEEFINEQVVITGSISPVPTGGTNKGTGWITEARYVKASNYLILNIISKENSFVSAYLTWQATGRWK